MMDYLPASEMARCLRCGAILHRADQALHAEWHVDIDAALSRARRP